MEGRVACSVCGKADENLFVTVTADTSVVCGPTCHARIGVHQNTEQELYIQARSLLDNGYAVIRVYTDEEVNQVRESFINILHGGMPEYLPDATLYVRGGFGALGNPSSFHAPIIRDIRRSAQQVAASMLLQYVRMRPEIDERTIRLEQLVDRARVLRDKAEIVQESWHRDTTPAHKMNKVNQVVLEDDLIFGGWIALDGPQKFSAIRGTHRDQHGHIGGRGFAPLNKADKPQYTEMKNTALERDPENGWYISIPPGHMLVFQQELIHEVVGGKYRGPESYRLFTGWRLTRSTHSFIKKRDNFFLFQGVTNIKSHQKPDMYPTMPWSSKTASREGLARWSRDTFQPCLLEDRSVESGEFKGETHHLIPRHMFSLYEVAVKRAAQDYVRVHRDILDQHGMEDYGDAEEAAAYEYANMICNTPPKVWRKQLHVEPRIGEGILGFLDWPSIEQYMFPPYTMQDSLILSPLRFAMPPQ